MPTTTRRMTRAKAKLCVAQMSQVLTNPDDLIEATMNDPELGPQYRDAIRRSLLRTVDIAWPAESLSDDELRAVSQELIDATCNANNLLMRKLTNIISHAGMAMSTLKQEDLFTIHYDEEVVRDSVTGYIGTPTPILEGTFDFLVHALGSADETSRRQMQALQSLPKRLQEGTYGFALALTMLVTDVYASNPERDQRQHMAPLVVSELIAVASQMITLPSVFDQVGDTKELLKWSMSLLGESLDEIADMCGDEKPDDESPVSPPVNPFIHQTPISLQ